LAAPYRRGAGDGRTAADAGEFTMAPPEACACMTVFALLREHQRRRQIQVDDARSREFRRGRCCVGWRRAARVVDQYVEVSKGRNRRSMTRSTSVRLTNVRGTKAARSVRQRRMTPPSEHTSTDAPARGIRGRYRGNALGNQTRSRPRLRKIERAAHFFRLRVPLSRTPRAPRRRRRRDSART